MNSKKLQILNIDGIEGVGKTTQLNIMANHLKKLEIPFMVNNFGSSIEDMDIAITNTEDFLITNSDGVVLNDGTIANPMVLDLSDGVSHQKIEDKYKDLLFKLQMLNHNYGMFNLLLIPDNIDICDKRLKQRQKLYGKEVVGSQDSIKQQTIMGGFDLFDYSVLSRNLKFQTLTVEESESIMQIHDNVLNLLRDGFSIKRDSNKESLWF